MYAVSPCKNCEERELGCHDRCIAYRQWKDEYTKTKIELEKITSGLEQQAGQYASMTRTKKMGRLSRSGKVD